MIRAALLALALLLASHEGQAQTIGGATPLPQPVQPSDKIFIFRNGAPVNSTTVATLLSGLTTGVFGPQSSTNAYVPQWNGVVGNSLSPGLPVNSTGPSTIVETLPSGLLSPSIMPAAPSPGSGNMIAPVTPGTVGNLVAWNGGTATQDSGLGVIAMISGPPGSPAAPTVPGLSTPGGIGFKKTTPTATDIANVLITRDAEFSGGTPGNVNGALATQCHNAAGITSYEWCSIAFMDNAGTQADGSQNTAFYARSIKRTTGSTWAAVFETDDVNISNTSSGAPVSVEMDVWRNGTYSGNNSGILNLVSGPLSVGAGGNGNAATVSTGLKIYGNAGNGGTVSGFGTGLLMGQLAGGSPTPFVTGIDFSQGSFSTAAIRLPAASASILWDNAGAEPFWFYEDNGHTAMDLDCTTFGTHCFQFSNAGILKATDGTVLMEMVPLAASSAGIIGTYSDHDLGIFTNSTERMRILAGGGVQLGINITADSILSAGEVSLNKISASGTAPGAGYLKFAATAGTNSGSCKVIAYAGTSATPVTVVDNVGGGC